MKIIKKMSFILVLPFLFGFTNIAHRGDNGLGRYTEHSFQAYDHAVINGADYLELDLQKTHDNVLVVSHDNNLGRVFGIDQNIEKSNFQDLRNVKNRAGESLHSLQEVFTRYKPDKIKFMIETKDGQIGMEQVLVKLIKQNGLENRILFESFSLSSLKKLAKLAPNIPRTQLGGDYHDISNNQYFSNGFYDKNAAEYLRKHDKGYILWGVEKSSIMQKMIAHGVTGLITDFPERLKNVMWQKTVLPVHAIDAVMKVEKPFAIVKDSYQILPKGSLVKVDKLTLQNGKLKYGFNNGWLSEVDVTAINRDAPYSEQGKIFLTRSASLWRDPLGDKNLDRSLRANSKWNYFAVSSVSGHKFYNLGSNQWIDGRDVSEERR
ncbi:glycerophosphodiester phosphodiesterase family protein [Lactobacillus sp. LL6]|uniref:glycerophosphodiester phosphodiesterase n=1 Tax=Lactobacillus sp. LL6 TaxID=2596827 RepID=UPI00118491B6|nr:glycerophosphodiester phosphodiesterase family protein [Lactobacillus sp. LL6]TSO26132.1 glycerophosphodiester phosphodiesterase [Lactobacillus sp. LL6]